MIADKIFNRSVERVEDSLIRGNKGRLVAVASREVLRGDDTDLFTRLGLYEKNFGVVVGKIGALHRLRDERPEFESLVCRLVVEDEIEGRDVAGLFNEEKAAQKLLRNGEGGLPNLGLADLT